MSFNVDWVERLQSVRMRMEDVTTINDPQNYQKFTGMLSFLHGPTNPKTIDAKMMESMDKNQYRPVQIRYRQYKGSESVITNDANLTCDPVEQRRDLLKPYEPNLFVADKFTIDEDYVRQNTEDFDSIDARIERETMDLQRRLRESINSQLVAKASTLIGSNPATGVGAGDYTDVELLNSDGSLSVNNFDVMKNDQEDNYQFGKPSVVGLGNMRRVFNRFAVGNVNTTAGIDFREVEDQFGMTFYKDQFTTDNLGDPNKVLLMYPGLQQFYHYNLNAGFYEQNTPDLRVKGRMPDAVYPFTYDYIWEYDKGCSTGNGTQGSWTMTMYLWFDMFTPPEDSFGDIYGELNDFTGIVGYNILQA